jgi:ribose transport system substrate-binding protein
VCATPGLASAATTSVGFASPVLSQQGQQDIGYGFKMAAKTVGWSASVLDANLSAQTQVSDVTTFIQQGKGAIASWTLDQGAIGSAYQQAEAKKIPVIGVNSTGAGIESTVWSQLEVCTTNGPIYQTAAFIKKYRPHAKVIVIGGPPVASIQTEVSCFEQAAKADGITVEATANNTADAEGPAATIAADLLTKNPNPDAIWSYNDDTALGASASVTSAGEKVSTGPSSGVMIFGINGDNDAIAAIRNGRMTATEDSDNVALGIATVKAMKDALAGHVDKNLVVKSTLYDAQNIKGYLAPRDRGYSYANIVQQLVPYK